MKNVFLKLQKINEFLERFSIKRKSLLYILFIMSVAAVSEACTAGLIIPFLNSFQNIQTSGSSDSKILYFLSQIFSGMNREEQFVYMLFSMLTLMAFVQFLLVYINRLVFKFAMFSIQYKVSSILFEEIINARLKFFYKQSSGSLINHIRDDVNRCYNCIYHLLKMVAPILLVISFLTISFLILPMYTVWFLVGAICIVSTFKFVLPYLYSLGEKNRKAQQDANNVIVETLQGIRTVILSSSQETHLKKFKDIIYRYYYTIYGSSWITTSVPYIVRFIALFIVIVILLINKDKVISTNPEAISQLLFFVYVSGNIFLKLGQINALHASFAFGYEGIVSLTQLDDDLKASKAINPIGKNSFSKFQKAITVKGLSFEYISNIRILHDLTFSIERNQRIAFIGSSGSGKSTLVDILSGFHDDYMGSILIDGQELRDLNKNHWRKIFGYVSQETFIFNDTVRNNLMFGSDHEVNEQELIDVCKKAQIYETIMSFPKKFDSELGERGVRLSGGEKQRLAVARLFLKNPPIVILDEATSALDSSSEKKVKDALDLLGEGRTVISVAHRLSTISDYDNIFVLEKGTIVEKGNHHQLIQQKGHYYRYFSIQSMEKSYA